MKIGIDIDGVILDSETNYKINAELFCLEHFGEDRVIDRSACHVEQRFDWPQEMIDKWHKENLGKAGEEAQFMPGAIKIINKLKEMGHELFVISARGDFCPALKDIAVRQFADANLKFDGCYFEIQDKGEMCEKLGIDLMIDDDYDNCIKISNRGIKTLFFRDVNIKKIERDNVIEVNNWGEIYKYIWLNSK